MIELLTVATENENEVFQFDKLVSQNDGAAMGSPFKFRPLMANTFLCFVAEQLERENKLPA